MVMSYVSYNSPKEISDLNLNEVYGRVSTLPSHMYAGEAFRQSTYLHEWRPRNSRTAYIYPEERTVHPDHFSRFAYNTGSDFGYVLGIHPGKYSDTLECSWINNQPPKDVAPARFYKNYQLDPFNDLSPAYYKDAASRGNIPIVQSDIRWEDYYKRR